MSRSLLAALILLTRSALAHAQGPLADATARLERREADLIAFRRDIHRYPELSGQERRTSTEIAERLRGLEFEVRTEVGGFGVVGVLRGAKPGPLVAFRADMDAVRSLAPDPVDFRSLTPGVRHICGHDVHAAIGLALAEAFAAVRDRMAGSVMLIFQPAEETGSGARAMLGDGAFGTERPVAIYALHTAPFELGMLATMAGGLMPGRDRVHVSLSGGGDLLGAMAAAEHLIRGVATVPIDSAFAAGPQDLVYVGGIVRTRMGAEAWDITGGLSIADPATRERVRARLERELGALGNAGVRASVRYDAKTIAGVTNDSTLVTHANAAIAAALGPAALRPLRGVLPAFSEDFGSFQEQVPGVMYFLGVSNAEKGTRGMPHAPDYVADEGAILVGAKAMVAVMLERMGRGAS